MKKEWYLLVFCKGGKLGFAQHASQAHQASEGK